MLRFDVWLRPVYRPRTSCEECGHAGKGEPEPPRDGEQQVPHPEHCLVDDRQDYKASDQPASDLLIVLLAHAASLSFCDVPRLESWRSLTSRRVRALVCPGFNGRHQFVHTPREDLRSHDLRHGALTEAARHGDTLAELMALGGHSTNQAAMRYQQAASGRLAELARKRAEARGWSAPDE